MKINVLFFSITREITGVTSYVVDFPDENVFVCPSKMLQEVYKTYPDLKDCSFKLAVNKKYIKPESDDMSTLALKDGDTVACIPPISGG